jgi:hypothetical protein
MRAMDQDRRRPRPNPEVSPADSIPPAELPNRVAPQRPRVDLDVMEQRLLGLREEMRLLHARLETLNLFTRLGVKPGKPSKD